MQTHQSFMQSYRPWLGSWPATSRPVLLPSWMNSDEPAPGSHRKIGSYHAQERLRGKPHTETDNSHPSPIRGVFLTFLLQHQIDYAPVLTQELEI